MHSSFLLLFAQQRVSRAVSSPNLTWLRSVENDDDSFVFHRDTISAPPVSRHCPDANFGEDMSQIENCSNVNVQPGNRRKSNG
jgi:hypothetical protein